MLKSGQSLKTHIQSIHEKNRKFKCSLCSMAFSLDFAMKRHIKAVHEKIRNHKCDSCDKRFFTLADKRHHNSAIHEGKKDHVCEYCQKAHSLKKSLTRDAAGNYPTRATRPVTRPALNRDNYPYYP